MSHLIRDLATVGIILADLAVVVVGMAMVALWALDKWDS